MKLALDHHFSRRIAESMRERGADVVAAIERDWHGLDDARLLEQCTAEGRALVTGDLGDFMPIAMRWSADGRTHAGLILVPNSAAATRWDSIGEFMTALAAVHDENPDPGALADRIVWLRRPTS